MVVKQNSRNLIFQFVILIPIESMKEITGKNEYKLYITQKEYGKQKKKKKIKFKQFDCILWPFGKSDLNCRFFQ